uniref:Uncharacterized protein n=1 Tax=Arundo donax TaxID=35708 RepID=A0A0A9EKC8_ARUDO
MMQSIFYLYFRLKSFCKGR